jgi:hypothetical protein
MENQPTQNNREKTSEDQTVVQSLSTEIPKAYAEVKGNYLAYSTAKNVTINGYNLKDMAYEEYRNSRIGFFSLMVFAFTVCENDVDADDRKDYDRCISILESADIDTKLEDALTLKDLKTTSLRILNNSLLSCLTSKTRLKEITTEMDVSEI